MTETGLLIALVAFLLLLFGFIWLVVRSSLRTIDDTAAPAVREPEPAPPEAVAEAEMPPPPPEPEVAPEPPPAQSPEAPAAGSVAAAGVNDPPTPPEPNAIAMDAAPADAGEPDDDAQDGTGAFDLSKDVAPRLIVESGAGLTVGHEIPLEGGLTIGRAGGSDLSLDDEFASHTHASIVRRGQFYFISDLGSTNGTFLNDRRVTDDAQLRVRDVLRLGDTRLRYEE